MFSQLTMAPADPILGLTEDFNRDTNPAKINLTTGVYKASDGSTPILACVKEAERRILEKEKSKGYLGIAGDARWSGVVQPMIFGADHEIVATGRAKTAHCPGGTGALRVAADFVKQQTPAATVWISDPTWANHAAIFKAAGLPVKTYPYYDPATNGLRFEALLETLRAVPAGDVVLLHGCCHNPSGMDPDATQWAAIAEVAQTQGWLPLFDLAYQGFGDGLEEDVVGLREFCRPGSELLIASSYSKNFGLYNERVGALTLVAAEADAAERAFSHVKIAIRSNYSNPPAHGGKVVIEILEDAALAAQWKDELAEMRARINGMRHLYVDTLKAKGVTRDYSFITRQRGMFSFAGITPQQVQRLRDEFAIYIVGSGRINVAGITESNVEPLCTALAKVLAE